MQVDHIEHIGFSCSQANKKGGDFCPHLFLPFQAHAIERCFISRSTINISLVV